MSAYEARKAELVAALAGPEAVDVGLAKDTSNLFRERPERHRPRLNLRHFDDVLTVDAGAGVVDVEGMTTFERLADRTLAHGVAPCVVPELKSITIGGAVAGVGIESSSFRYGLVHHTITEMEVLTGDARVLVCTPDNAYRDLFHGLPNSYGTLGYALRLKARTRPVKRFVQVAHAAHSDMGAYFDALRAACAGDADFIDGTVFARDQLFLSVGRFVDEAPWVSDYTFEKIYYRSIRERATDYLTAHDYLWRWDTDWFWCSKNLLMQHPIVRRIAGRERLNSVTYTRIMRWNSKWGLTHRLFRWTGRHSESVIQDVDIPIDRAAEFLDFFLREIGIVPVWICPIQGDDGRFPLYPLARSPLYVNFGFWDVVKAREPRPPGYYNRLIERKVQGLGGIKSLYSDSYYERDEFWSIYDKRAYDTLKRKYDPGGRLGDLYDKIARA